MKILLLEDDLNLRETLHEELEDALYNVDSCASSDEIIDYSYNNKYDLYLFDVNVIGINGFELLKQLRSSGDNTPTIFLTSKIQTKDLSDGFESGADDYISKPFIMEELLIRIKRFFKKPYCIKINNTITYYPDKLSITNQNITNQLNKKEAQFLEYFLHNPNRVISKDEIINELFETQITDSTFRVYVKNIKKATGGIEILKNIRGEGYIFEMV